MTVLATAGHVDHGKSSLIVRLTGIDPDRWEEEKRRGLTIDLGYAWCELPSGREVGFVDVPGHERFVRNMLAGVGPVQLVLFVVAADEGWKPQSEEHLSILDVLDAVGGVVALTKADLVDDDRLAEREVEVRDRLTGTPLADAPIVACSSATGAGIQDVLAALDALVTSAGEPEDLGRPRVHVDRSFTIRGAGTVVTGTLTGGSIEVGEEAAVLPGGRSARIRSLQTHRRSVEVARPASRVAANLAGTSREEAERGDVLARPGQWRPTSTVEVLLRPVRSLTRPIGVRGAFKLHVGAAERDATLRLYDEDRLEPGGEAFARLRLSKPVVVTTGDRFVLRESGRRETVGGGVILDPHPPPRPGEPAARLRRRMGLGPQGIPAALVEERRAVRARELPALAGHQPTRIEGASLVDGWWLSDAERDRLATEIREALEGFHRDHPLRPAMDTAELLAAVRPRLDGVVAEGVLAGMERAGEIVREGPAVRLAGHRVALGDREPEAARLVERVRAAEPTPPSVPELIAEGYPRELVDACLRVGRLRAVSRDIVLSPELHAEAERVARAAAAEPEGLTVSRFRELLGTTRKYALPILEHLDARGVTRREGDVRRASD